MMIIRSAGPEDIDNIIELWNRAAGPTRQPGQHVEARRLIAYDSSSLFVADRDGRIVGTAIVGWDGWRCHLYRLAVDPEFRRSGIGRALMEEATRRATELGANRLDAMVNVDNGQAIAFWEQIGFKFDPDDGRWSMIQ